MGCVILAGHGGRVTCWCPAVRGRARAESRAHLGRGGALARGRFGCAASSIARLSVAAGMAAGGEGSGARSITLSF